METCKIIQYYQGDIPILKNVSLPDNLKFKPLPKKGLVVAEGESTGNFHVILPKTKECEVSYAEYLDNWYMQIDKGEAEIKHQEHGAIVLTPGIYFIGKQYEYDELSEYIRVKD